MNIMCSLVKAGFALTCLLATAAHAHHPVDSQYDMSRQYTIEGTLKRIELASPHSFMHVHVVDENGDEGIVRVEWGAASSLANLYQISRGSIRLDQKIRVSGYLSRNREDFMIWPMSIYTEFDFAYDRQNCNRIERTGRRCVVLKDTPPLWPVLIQ